MNVKLLTEIVERVDKDFALALVPADTLTKFAELIVSKCAEVADTADATREKWEGIGKYVREHFGVEE